MSFSWSENSISIKQSNGSTICLFNNGNSVYGEIDRGDTEDFKFKRWRTWRGFEVDSWARELKSMMPLKAALWEYFFPCVGNSFMTLHSKDTANLEVLTIHIVSFLKSLDLPYPCHKEKDRFFIKKSDRVYTSQTSVGDDSKLLSKYLSDLDSNFHESMSFQEKIKEYANLIQYAENKGEKLSISIPTEDDYPMYHNFVTFYSECLYKAYKITDLRLLYKPFELTNLFKCPFSGRTPAIENILTSI